MAITQDKIVTDNRDIDQKLQKQDKHIDATVSLTTTLNADLLNFKEMLSQKVQDIKKKSEDACFDLDLQQTRQGRRMVDFEK